jgi:hypothetical protein
MIIQRLSFILAVTIQLIGTAHAQSQQIEIIVPRGTEVTVGSGRDVGVLLGRTLGTVTDVGDCGSFAGDHQIFAVVFVHPGDRGSTQSNLIVVFADEPLHGGLQLTQFEALGICVGRDGREYDKYRADGQFRNDDPAPSQIQFIAPLDARVLSGQGFGFDIGVVLGRPVGTVNGPLADCASHGSFPLHNVVFTHPGASAGSTVAGVIVTAQDAPLSPGTRFEDISPITSCTAADGSVYSKYMATVRPVAANQ